MSQERQQLDLFTDLSAFEGTDVEYKGAKGGLPGDLWSTYSAFANTEGGTIYLGITQRGDELDVHGVENPEKLIGDFWNTVNNRSKVNINLLGNQDVEQLAVDGASRKVIAIHVPRATRQQRPVFVGSDPRIGTFRRNFEGDYRCTDIEVRRMFADQSEEPADSRIMEGFSLDDLDLDSLRQYLMEGFSLDDLDLDSLRQYRNRFQSRASGHPWLTRDDRGLLEQLGGWRRDRASGLEGLTRAGLLMFGKTSAIQAVEAVPGFHLDYRERLADDPRVRWSDRLTIDGYWEANVFQFYQQMMARFARDPGLKRPFAQDAEGVRPMGTLVHDALQEALVNALIHADYSGQGGIVIDRFVDRFEFSNPGTLLVSLEQILRGAVSECRNKSLQLMFQMLGVGDKAGSGIDKIRDSWRSQHWQSPRLEETQRPDRVKLTLPLVSMLPEPVLASLASTFGARFRALDKDSVHVLATAHMEGSVSNHRLQETLTLHRRDITGLLQSLVKEGFLVPDGFGRGTRYELGRGEDGAGEAIPPHNAGIPPDKETTSPHNAGIPSDKGTIPSHNAGIPPDKETIPSDSAEFLAQREASSDPTLIAIAMPVRSTRRVDPAVTRATILALCQGRFLSPRQLASLLERNPETLRERFISPMVQEGVLELRHPDKPSRKDQAYRSTSSAGDQA